MRKADTHTQTQSNELGFLNLSQIRSYQISGIKYKYTFRRYLLAFDSFFTQHILAINSKSGDDVYLYCIGFIPFYSASHRQSLSEAGFIVQCVPMLKILRFLPWTSTLEQANSIDSYIELSIKI